jgi:hypothetical protein
MENEAMEIMENVADAIVEDNTMSMPVEGEATGANIGTTLVRTFIIGGVLVGAYLVVKKDEIKKKITNHRIKKLVKAGYTVVKNEDIVDETIENCVDDVEE